MRNAKNGKEGQVPPPAAEAAKVVTAYALFGGLWILLSDRLLLSLSPDTAFYHSFQTYKGWFYVGATAILLYYLIRRSMERTRRLEEEKRQSELKLLQAQKMEIVGRLAGGIAHDFNNILTAIMSLSQLTAKNLPEGDPRRADVEEITRFSEKAAAITRQLLVFSRKREAQPRPLDPGETLRNAGSMLRRAAGEKIRLGISAGPGLRPISADPGQLEQALMNLAVNARDAMPEGGTLELSAVNVELKEPLAAIERDLPPGDYVALSARDSGVGMDRATMERLFEPFFTTKPEGKGTGLGLSVIRGIVDGSRGAITVESAPGAGTVFTLYFPALAEAPAAPAVPAPSAAAETAGGTVLLVDDEEDVRRALARILAGAGYKVLTAGDYEEAMKLAAGGKRIDLLVTDTALPGKEGPDLAAAVTTLHPEAGVLFISGRLDEESLKRRTTEKERPFLLKPFPAEVFLEKVREAAGGKDA